MNWMQALSAQKMHSRQNAGIKSTQLMPWRVNTIHTMGVDVIDKTVGGEGDDPLTQNHWTFHKLDDMLSRPYKTLWS